MVFNPRERRYYIIISPRNERSGQEDRARRKTRGLDALKKRLESDMREIAKRLAASREPDLRSNGDIANAVYT